MEIQGNYDTFPLAGSSTMASPSQPLYIRRRQPHNERGSHSYPHSTIKKAGRFVGTNFPNIKEFEFHDMYSCYAILISIIIVSHDKYPSMIYGSSAQERGELIQFNLQRC